MTLTCLLVLAYTSPVPAVLAQKRAPRRAIQTSHSRNRMSTEMRETIEVAGETICNERVRDPKGSVPIDDMQARPSLPVDSPEAIAGAQRAQRLLPSARRLVLVSLRLLSREYNLRGARGHALRIQRAIARVKAVREVHPDVDSRT